MSMNGATETTLVTLAQQGAPVTGQSLEAGGSAVLGWFSSLRKAITDRLPTSLVSGRLDVNVGASAVVQVGDNGGLLSVDDGAGSLTVDGTVTAGFIAKVVTATLTRPANTTTYTAGDELTDTGGAILSFSGCAQAN